MGLSPLSITIGRSLFQTSPARTDCRFALISGQGIHYNHVLKG